MRRLLFPLTAAILLALPAAASADKTLEGMFQDDPSLLSSNKQLRDKTLDEAKALGAQRIRVTAFWNRYAPAATQTAKPTAFDGSNPDSYEPGRFDILDSLITDAKARGLEVNLNPTAPGPKWAASGFFEDRLDQVTNPSPIEFAGFVAALGRRYSGTYTPAGASAPLPRINYWSIWNEPNQGAWLAPQWKGTGKSAVPASPGRYRVLVAGAWAALGATGHSTSTDTVLVGDTAPKGTNTVRTVATAMAPITFIQRLYCLDSKLQFLKGSAAEDQGCSATPNAAQFVKDNPALFQMTGYAHHPYELSFAPNKIVGDTKLNVTTANLGFLTDQLDRVMARYGQSRKLPLFLTEYGYQTDPPDKSGVSLSEQAAYINQGQYIAYRNSRVKTLSQFLLTDDAPKPDTDKADKWDSSFQSGLRFGPESGKEGKAKPALAAYRMPFFLPKRTISGRRLKIWGQVRLGSGVRSAKLQLRGKTGSYKSSKTVKTNSAGYVDTTVTVRSSSRAARLMAKVGGKTYYSRGVSFKVK